jgi:hypothetical protein
VASFWQPFAEVAHRFARTLLEIVQDSTTTVNERERAVAEQTAAEGVQLALGLALKAQAIAMKVDRPLDQAIIACADGVEASLIAPPI